MKMNCASCHTSAGWEISASYWQSLKPGEPVFSKTTGAVNPDIDARFHHNHTEFELKGRHATVDCRSCHETLVFSEAKTKDDCASCHTDIHQQTTGNDCARCHTPNNWLVDNIQELHHDNGFPLTGVHRAVSCEECHQSASTLQFNRLGNDCISCHRSDFEAAASPNHVSAGYSTNCQECHNVFTPGWGTDKVDHSFFPLTKGHEVADCAKCHVGGDFMNTPNTCVACHQADYNTTQNPNHQSAGISTDCAQCHTTDLGWMPASYPDHDALHFPIYSGKHNGQWSNCADCHNNPSDYSQYTCTNCHTNPETNNSHNGISGYTYENSACLACHPTGDATGAFDHNTTDFPLTGAHVTTACVECHSAGYVGTPTQCSACHTTDFNQSTNPNHVSLGIPMDCATCHTTTAWEPATFPIHNNYYTLNGAHTGIANDCAACHNGDYNNTPNTCNGCHNSDYTATTNPNHATLQFSTDCASCHSETAWMPATFDHNTTDFPLTGAHVTTACVQCHSAGYAGTPTQCAACHTTDFNQSTNPNHVSLGIPMDCAMCHTTTAWEPATFPIHNNYYTLNGAHASIANNCVACHNGNYNNTPNTCMGCHTQDFNTATNPNHQSAQFPTDCLMCHNETAWEPSTFDHDDMYFPIYSGKHKNEWDQCSECHTTPGNYQAFSCIICHEHNNQNAVNQDHQGISGYQYNSNACYTCHPDGSD